MSDYISIQNAIEKINERARNTFTLGLGYEFYLGALHDVADDLRQIPTIDAVPAWIPVTERFPEDDRMVLVTAQPKKGEPNVNRAFYMNGFWHGSGSMSGVTAWMPLPEPYSGERKDDE